MNAMMLLGTKVFTRKEGDKNVHQTGCLIRTNNKKKMFQKSDRDMSKGNKTSLKDPNPGKLSIKINKDNHDYNSLTKNRNS